jgi:hypothetical protein
MTQGEECNSRVKGESDSHGMGFSVDYSKDRNHQLPRSVLQRTKDIVILCKIDVKIQLYGVYLFLWNISFHIAWTTARYTAPCALRAARGAREPYKSKISTARKDDLAE